MGVGGVVGAVGVMGAVGGETGAVGGGTEAEGNVPSTAGGRGGDHQERSESPVHLLLDLGAANFLRSRGLSRHLSV